MNMKKLLSLITLLAVLAVQQKALAVTQVFTVLAGTAWNATNFFTIGSRINTIDISTGSGTGATNLTYALIDAPTNAPAFGWGPIKYTNGTYVQLSSYLTNITKITTNFTGFLTTNIFTNALYTYTNTVGATSNDWRRVVVGSVASNTTTIRVFTGPVYVTYGLGLTNNNIGVTTSITVDYDPYL